MSRLENGRRFFIDEFCSSSDIVGNDEDLSDADAN